MTPPRVNTAERQPWEMRGWGGGRGRENLAGWVDEAFGGCDGCRFDLGSANCYRNRSHWGIRCMCKAVLSIPPLQTCTASRLLQGPAELGEQVPRGEQVVESERDHKRALPQSRQPNTREHSLSALGPPRTARTQRDTTTTHHHQRSTAATPPLLELPYAAARRVSSISYPGSHHSAVCHL